MQRMIEYVSSLWDEKLEKDWTEEQKLMGAVVVERSQTRSTFLKELHERMAWVEKQAKEAHKDILSVEERLDSFGARYGR